MLVNNYLMFKNLMILWKLFQCEPHGCNVCGGSVGCMNQSFWKVWIFLRGGVNCWGGQVCVVEGGFGGAPCRGNPDLLLISDNTYFSMNFYKINLCFYLIHIISLFQCVYILLMMLKSPNIFISNLYSLETSFCGHTRFFL